MTRSTRRADLLAVLLLALLLGALFIPPLRAGKVLSGPDLHNEIAPMRGWLQQEWERTGTVPAWNPYLFCGYPNLNALRGEVIYPFDIIFRWITPLRAYSWSVFFHALLAALGAYAAGRKFRLSPLASFLTATVFVGSFPLMLKLFTGHVTEYRCIAWFPLVIVTLESCCREGTPRWWLLLALLVGLQSLVWAPDVLVYCLYIYVLYAIVRPTPRRGRVKELAARLVKLGIALALGLVVFLPTIGFILAWTPYLARAQVYPSPINNQLGLRSLLMMFIPELFGTPRELSFWAWPASGNGVTVYKYYPFWEETIFIGIAPMVLVVLGITGRQWRYRTLFLILIGLCLLVGLGENTPFYHAVRLFPGLGQFRVPSRTLLPMVLFLALLVGRGLDLLRRRWRHRPRIALMFFSLAGGLALIGLLVRTYPATVLRALEMALGITAPAGAAGIVAAQISAGGFSLFAAAVTAACVFLPVYRLGRGRWLLVAVALVDLLLCAKYVGWQDPPGLPAWVEELRVLIAVEREPERVRVLTTKGTGFAPDRFPELGIATVNGADPMRFSSWVNYVDRINGGGTDPMASELWVTTTDAAALEEMRVKYYVTTEPTAIDGFVLLKQWPGPAPILLYCRPAPFPEPRGLPESGLNAGLHPYPSSWRGLVWFVARLWLWGLAFLTGLLYAIHWRRKRKGTNVLKSGNS